MLEPDVHPTVKSTRQRMVRNSAAFFINMSLSIFCCAAEIISVKFVNVSFCVIVSNFNCFYNIMQFFEYQHNFFENI